MIKTIYSEKQNVDVVNFVHGSPSPSAKKPRLLAERLHAYPELIEFIAPNPITRDDLKVCHDHRYVDGVLDLKLVNGFNNKSPEIAASLMYTNGAMYDAAKAATTTSPSAALVSGFHHAGFNGWTNGIFCTFNGLMMSATKLLNEGYAKVAIIDADWHYGDGTVDIISKLPRILTNRIYHYTLGQHFTNTSSPEAYLSMFEYLGPIYSDISIFKPDVIIYQAGADPHIADPQGGILTTEQLRTRDNLIFNIAKSLNISIAWDLAGGYQIDSDGSIDKVLDIHINTFLAAKDVYGL